LHQQLANIDADAAARIHCNDPQRIQRALEVQRLTGRTLSDLQQQTVCYLPAAPIRFGLMPESRAWLHARIEQRFDLMMAAGFLAEMQALKKRNVLSLDLPAMRSVGYRQAWQHLAGETDALTFREQALAATRQLAKRQLTWMRGMPHMHMLLCDQLAPEHQLTRCLEKLEAAL